MACTSSSTFTFETRAAAQAVIRRETSVIPFKVMTFEIPEDIQRISGLTEREAVVELACRLFAAGRMDLPAATRWTGLDRTAFESELISRGVAPFKPTVDDLRTDMETLSHLERIRRDRSGKVA